MLEDWFCDKSQPTDDEYQYYWDEMNLIYDDKMSPSCAERLHAYRNNRVRKYMTQITRTVTCLSCHSSWYYGFKEQTTVCTLCDNSDIILEEVTYREIAPWVDIFSFTWRMSDDVNQDENYENDEDEDEDDGADEI